MIRFLYDNWLDDGTLTASSEAAGYPVENIQHRWYTRHWRSTGVAAESVTCDLGSTKAVKSLVVKYHNFQAGATVKIQADSAATFDSGGGGNPELNVTLTVTTETIVYNWSAGQSYRYWRLTIADAGNPDGYVRVGRMYLGTYWSPTYHVKERTMIPRDPSTIVYSTGGQAFAYEKTKYYEYDYVFNVYSSDLTTWKAIFEEVGRSKPYFICEDPASAATTTFYVQNIDDWNFDSLNIDVDDFVLVVETAR